MSLSPTRFININTTRAAISVSADRSYVIIQLDDEYAPKDKLEHIARSSSINTSLRHSYGVEIDVRISICNLEGVARCVPMYMSLGFLPLTAPRDYDLYEELYLGTISNSIIPTHYITYLEMYIDQTRYYVAIDAYIKSPTVHIFVEPTYDRLITLLKARYSAKYILV
jgi:hypothetical protein